MRTFAGLFLLVGALLFVVQPQALSAQNAGSGGGSLARGGEVVGKVQFPTLRKGDATHGRVARGGEVVGMAQFAVFHKGGTDSGGQLSSSGDRAGNGLFAGGRHGTGNGLFASNGNGAGNGLFAGGRHGTGNGLFASNGNGAGNGLLAHSGHSTGNGLLAHSGDGVGNGLSALVENTGNGGGENLTLAVV